APTRPGRLFATTRPCRFSASGFQPQRQVKMPHQRDHDMTDFSSTLLDTYLQRIVCGLREYTEAYGFKKVLVGSSGGIDSALTIALAAQALGPESVTAITMPSVFSSPGSVTDSQKLCDNLGVELLECPIRDIVDQVSASMK